MKHYVREEWDKYATVVLTGVPTEQRGELKRAFYAGSASTLMLINRLMTPGALPTEKDIKVIDDIVHELRVWGKTQQRMDELRENAAADHKPGPVKADIMRMLESMARDCVKALDAVTNDAFEKRALGFTLFLFSFGGSELTYISNADRPNMIKTLYEFLAAAPPAMTWDEQHG